MKTALEFIALSLLCLSLSVTLLPDLLPEALAFDYWVYIQPAGPNPDPVVLRPGLDSVAWVLSGIMYDDPRFDGGWGVQQVALGINLAGATWPRYSPSPRYGSWGPAFVGVYKYNILDELGNVVWDPIITIGSAVGGTAISIDKLSLLAPYFGLTSAILVATVASAIYVKRVKRRKEKQ